MRCEHKSISGDVDFLAATRNAVATKCTVPARRCESASSSRRPFLTVRTLGGVPTVKRRRRSSRARTFAFSLPRRQQLAILDFPELRAELARRQRVLLTQLGLDIMGAGFGLNATARLLGVSASRLCTWFQDYRRSGPTMFRSKAQVSRLSKRTACKISFHLAL